MEWVFAFTGAIIGAGIMNTVWGCKVQDASRLGGRLLLNNKYYRILEISEDKAWRL